VACCVCEVAALSRVSPSALIVKHHTLIHRQQEGMEKSDMSICLKAVLLVMWSRKTERVGRGEKTGGNGNMSEDRYILYTLLPPLHPRPAIGRHYATLIQKHSTRKSGASKKRPTTLRKKQGNRRRVGIEQRRKEAKSNINKGPPPYARVSAMAK
jgi:hypothetical protein